MPGTRCSIRSTSRAAAFTSPTLTPCTQTQGPVVRRGARRPNRAGTSRRYAVHRARAFGLTTVRPRAHGSSSAPSAAYPASATKWATRPGSCGQAPGRAGPCSPGARGDDVTTALRGAGGLARLRPRRLLLAVAGLELLARLAPARVVAARPWARRGGWDLRRALRRRADGRAGARGVVRLRARPRADGWGARPARRRGRRRRRRGPRRGAAAEAAASAGPRPPTAARARSPPRTAGAP